MRTRPGRVELHVEELVLHGFEPGDRYRIGDAIEQELARLLAERGLPPAPMDQGERDSVDAGRLHLDAGASARTIGTRVARAVYGGLAQ